MRDGQLESAGATNVDIALTALGLITLLITDPNAPARIERLKVDIENAIKSAKVPMIDDARKAEWWRLVFSHEHINTHNTNGHGVMAFCSCGKVYYGQSYMDAEGMLSVHIEYMREIEK